MLHFPLTSPPSVAAMPMPQEEKAQISDSPIDVAKGLAIFIIMMLAFFTGVEWLTDTFLIASLLIILFGFFVIIPVVLFFGVISLFFDILRALSGHPPKDD